MNKFTKITIVSLVLVAFSVVGFGTAFGYGSHQSSTQRAAVVAANEAAAVAAALAAITNPTGRVLGDTTFRFTTFQSQGTTGDSVMQLQERLRALGFFTYPTSTGFFGPFTLAAVRAFQAENGIPATGFVGPLTLAALNR